MSKLALCLHKGAVKVEYSDVQKSHTPEATRSWAPIPHAQFVDSVTTALSAGGFTIKDRVHGLGNGEDRYFGLMEVQGRVVTQDYTCIIGLRNSHDKRFGAGIVAGARVFVCDNLSFSGEVRMSRKHTTNCAIELPSLAAAAITTLADKWGFQQKRFEHYKNAPVNALQVHDLVIRAADSEVCAYQAVPKVLKAYRKPEHDEFLEPTAWSLFNAFTGVMRGDNLETLPSRTMRLHELLDEFASVPV